MNFFFSLLYSLWPKLDDKVKKLANQLLSWKYALEFKKWDSSESLGTKNYCTVPSYRGWYSKACEWRRMKMWANVMRIFPWPIIIFSLKTRSIKQKLIIWVVWSKAGNLIFSVNFPKFGENLITLQHSEVDCKIYF